MPPLRGMLQEPLDERGLPPGSSEMFLSAPGRLADRPDAHWEIRRAFAQAQARIRKGLDFLVLEELPPVVRNDLLEITGTETGTHLRYRQTVRGHKLLGSSFAVHSADGADYAITGLVVKDIDAVDPGEPRVLPRQEVAKHIRELLGVDEYQRLTTDLVVLPDRRWAYEATVRLTRDGRPQDLRVYVDSETLDLLWLVDVAASAVVPALAHAINPDRTPPLDAVDLTAVGPPPGYLLETLDLDVWPEGVGRLQRPSPDYQLADVDAGFDEVQTFYHLRQGLNFYRTLMPPATMSKPWLRPVRAVVHDPNSEDNAYFEPSSGEILLGDFFGGRPSARSGDIIVHELGHAVSHAVTGWGEATGQQTKSLTEAFADYFAASLFDDPIIGDYVTDNDPSRVRDLAKPASRLPWGLSGDEHSMGEIIGGILWAMHGLDPAYANAVAAEALQQLHLTSTIAEGIDALTLADARLDPGQARGMAATIVDEWSARKP